ncbi:MAG: XdhC family protein [Candidatus Andeanibacterium colombiense]|uniref:XdhC family protein n=1 Tax=Candidatus Andeanibacterium colombiense TaxID=3121345 RepID=A0AAJ6BQI3_9SPHN|nr:MAG: XdhC family protein [Sphingomonadaceae bacterium]
MSGDHDALFLAAEGDAALCTIVGIDGSFSRRVGAQLAVARDGTVAGDLADNCLNAELANQAAEAVADGAVRMLRYGKGSPFIDFRLPCGSGLDIVIDPNPDRSSLAAAAASVEARQESSLALPLPADTDPGFLATRRYIPPVRLLVLGAGAECTALVDLARTQGIAADWREAGNGLALDKVPNDLAADPWTAVLLLFHDHEWEHALLKWALSTDAFYIGAQGGAPARVERLARLRAAGLGDDQLTRINSPIGLIPRARDPQVLALSVLADVVGAHEALHPHR